MNEAERYLQTITIGMPTHNRAWSLPKVLEAITNLDYQKAKLRIIFVDNHSTDTTQEILNEFQKKNMNEYESIRVVVEKTNIPEARNLCVQEAMKSDYIMFIDSDIIPPPNTIKHLLNIFYENLEAGFVGLPPQHYPALLGERAWFSKMPNRAHATETIGHDCTLVRMDVYRKIGSYNLEFGADEDTELIWRAKRAGYTVILDPSIKVLHLMKQTKSSSFKSIVDGGRFMFSKMAYYRFKLLVEFHHFGVLQKWGFYTLLLLSILLLPIAIIYQQIILSLSFIVLFVFLFAFHAIRAKGIMRLINPIFYALMGMVWALGMWKQLIRYITVRVQRKSQ